MCKYVTEGYLCISVYREKHDPITNSNLSKSVVYHTFVPTRTLHGM